jgi:hypothetical protein
VIFFDCCFSWRLTSWTQDLLCHGGVQFLMGKKIPDFLPPKFRPPYGLCSASRALLATAIGIPGGKKYGIIFKISEVLHFCV